MIDFRNVQVLNNVYNIRGKSEIIITIKEEELEGDIVAYWYINKGSFYHKRDCRFEKITDTEIKVFVEPIKDFEVMNDIFVYLFILNGKDIIAKYGIYFSNFFNVLDNFLRNNLDKYCLYGRIVTASNDAVCKIPIFVKVSDQYYFSNENVRGGNFVYYTDSCGYFYIPFEYDVEYVISCPYLNINNVIIYNNDTEKRKIDFYSLLV